jgi:hypothetical protein
MKKRHVRKITLVLEDERRYLKKYPILCFDFYLALLKCYQRFWKLYFWIFLQCTGTKVFSRVFVALAPCH